MTSSNRGPLAGQIGNRNFQIKNAIEWEKFKNGF